MAWYSVDPKRCLVLRWFADDSGDGTGRLFVEASSNGFAGASSAWFGASELAEFGRRLTAYPPADDPVSVSSGYGLPGGGGFVETVRLAVRPVGGRGQIRVSVHLAREDEGYDVRLDLLTTFERVRTFAVELEQALRGTIPEVTLGGEELM